MKVGAGGLQSIIMSDMAKALDNPAKPRAGIQETLAQAHGQDKNVLKEELNKAVERLNHLAESLNYPILLAIKMHRSGPKIIQKDKATGKERELELSEMDQLAQHLESAKGLHLDNYT